MVFANSRSVNAPTTARLSLNVEMGRSAYSWLSGGEDQLQHRKPLAKEVELKRLGFADLLYGSFPPGTLGW